MALPSVDVVKARVSFDSARVDFSPAVTVIDEIPLGKSISMFRKLVSSTDRPALLRVKRPQLNLSKDFHIATRTMGKCRRYALGEVC